MGHGVRAIGVSLVPLMTVGRMSLNSFGQRETGWLCHRAIRERSAVPDVGCIGIVIWKSIEALRNLSRTLCCHACLFSKGSW